MLSSGSCLGVTSRPHRLFIGRPGAALTFYQIPGIIAMTEKIHCDDSPPVITEKNHCDDRKKYHYGQVIDGRSKGIFGL